MSTKNQPPTFDNKSQRTNRQSPPGAEQVDDPIIVKGGSISIRFDQHNFRDLTGSTTEPNRRFDHEFGPSLQRLKIFRDGAIVFQTPLNRSDAVMICYEGSTCPDTLPD
jgi:hypothetical protein